MLPRRILIVDDEIGSARLLKANLELTGRYQVQVEHRPERTVEVAREFKPHLFLLDVIMPSLSGPQLASMLQGDPGLSAIPIVFLTAAPTSLLPQSADPILRGRPCISKPVCMEEILQSLEQILPPGPVVGPESQTQPGATTWSVS
jgi:CheY-like chemotaxis protein